MDVTGDGSKVQCCKEQYCIGTWNVMSMNQGKLEVVKQEKLRAHASSRVETGMSGNFLSCSKGVKDPLEVPEVRCD